MTKLDQIVTLVQAMLRLPFYASLPGSVLEEILAHVYEGVRTGTYDFVDVVSESTNTGWQVKSTRVGTPVTWKRVKLPNKPSLIQKSLAGGVGARTLGHAIIEFCNQAALASVTKYGLKKLYYARLIDHMDGRLTYFERELPISAILFDPKDFSWSWSKAKINTKKEQLAAFHGVHKRFRRPWFAWHGLSENQLHFKGEPAWWPQSRSVRRRDFRQSGEKLRIANLAEMISRASRSLK